MRRNHYSRRPAVAPPFDGQAGRCCWCGSALTGRKTRWCGKPCVDAYLIARGDQQRARALVIERDRGQCVLCSKVVARYEERVRKNLYTGKPDGTYRNWITVEKWEADHMVPISEGGALSIENLRTLCRPCHLSETAKLAARRAAARRALPETRNATLPSPCHHLPVAPAPAPTGSLEPGAVEGGGGAVLGGSR